MYGELADSGGNRDYGADPVLGQPILISGDGIVVNSLGPVDLRLLDSDVTFWDTG